MPIELLLAGAALACGGLSLVGTFMLVRRARETRRRLGRAEKRLAAIETRIAKQGSKLVALRNRLVVLEKARSGAVDGSRLQLDLTKARDAHRLAQETARSLELALMDSIELRRDLDARTGGPA